MSCRFHFRGSRRWSSIFSFLLHNVFARFIISRPSMHLSVQVREMVFPLQDLLQFFPEYTTVWEHIWLGIQS